MGPDLEPAPEGADSAGVDDLFRALGLTRRLALDHAALDEAYYALSRRLHPDFFAKAPEEERRHSAERMALINRAHETLIDPIRRAEYVLGLEGHGNWPPPAGFLANVFELEEALDAFRQDGQGRERLVAGMERLRVAEEDGRRRLPALFMAYDAGDLDALDGIGKVLAERRFIARLLGAMEEALEAPWDGR